MAEQDFYFQMTAETMQQRLNQVPINTSAIEQEETNRQEADEALSLRIDSKQNALTFDDAPTPNSQNPVKSGGIKTAIDQMGATKQNVLTFDNAPALGSLNPVTSNGIKQAVDSEEARAREAESALNTAKQDKLTFDNAPTPNSTNPVTSSGIKGAIDAMGATKQNVLTFDNAPAAGSLNPVTSAGIAAAIQNFITRSVTDLVNYYTKTDTYTKTEVQTLIASVSQFQFEVVETLPTASADTMGKIYLIPSAHAVTDNIKDEYITILTEVEGSMTYKWEQIGTTAVDLSGYYTKTEINGILADYSTTTQMLAAIAQALTSYYTKTEVNNLLLQKADKVANATNGNLAELDANGNLRDAGKKVGDFQLKILDLAPIGFGKGTCSTAGNVAEKVVTIPNFLLLKGGIVCVHFINAFTATGATLNINSLGAKAIKLYDSNIPPHKVHNHSEVTMMYDGEVFDVISIENQGESGVLGAVDLSLPSGLLWADHNVGAATPDAVGLYFSWGNVIGHTDNDEYDFGTSNDGPYAETPGAALTSDIAVGNTYDAARHNMGAPWRLPTVAEFRELVNNCDSEWTDENGMAGRRFTSLVNGNSIFFPASGLRHGTGLHDRGSRGYYWSASLHSQTSGYNLIFYSTGVNPAYSYNRFYGFSVRAVQ